jgi:hypothetical protein
MVRASACLRRQKPSRAHLAKGVDRGMAAAARAVVGLWVLPEQQPYADTIEGHRW